MGDMWWITTPASSSPNGASPFSSLPPSLPPSPASSFYQSSCYYVTYLSYPTFVFKMPVVHTLDALALIPLPPFLPPSYPSLRWFDLVLVVRADNATLFDRLSARGYSTRKRNENLECEIMQVEREGRKERGKEGESVLPRRFACVRPHEVRTFKQAGQLNSLSLPPFPPLPRWYSKKPVKATTRRWSTRSPAKPKMICEET